MPTYQQHVTRLFNTLRRINPGNGFEEEYTYYEVRATLDIVNHVGNEQTPTKEFEVVFTAAGMLETSWTGYFKVDIHPEFVFEVTYNRKDESSELSSYKVIPNRKHRSSIRRRARFDEEISQIRGGY